MVPSSLTFNGLFINKEIIRMMSHGNVSTFFQGGNITNIINVLLTHTSFA